MGELEKTGQIIQGINEGYKQCILLGEDRRIAISV